MSAVPSTLTAVLTAASEVSKLALALIQKNAELTASLAAHAAALQTAPEPGPPPQTAPKGI